MSRPRLPLALRIERKSFVAYFVHPLFKRTVRLNLGRDHPLAQRYLEALNAIFLDPDQWQHPPPETPAPVLEAWRGKHYGVILEGGRVTVDGEPLAAKPGTLARLAAENEFLKRENAALRAETRKLRKGLEQWMGRRVRSGPCPTLEQALERWLSHYLGRDPDHTAIVRGDLTRFVAHFGPGTSVDQLEGQEREIDGWLRGLTVKQGPRRGQPIGAGRRLQLRRHVLRFLTDSGLSLERKAIAAPGRREVRRDRAPIHWLTREQAAEVARALPPYWADLFRVQVGLGLRPDELITLKRGDFDPELTTLVVSPLAHLTLKEGSRRLRVPEPVARIVRRRLAELPAGILFPQPSAPERPWSDPKYYDSCYNAALRKAGQAAGIPFRLDCRTGRRTCASLLLRCGRSLGPVWKLSQKPVEV